MTRSIFTFFAMFVVGAVVALVARAALYRAPAITPPPVAEYQPMVANRPTATAASPSPAARPSEAPTENAPAPGANHDHGATAAPKGKPVNTVCAICGMEVDPKLPTAEYQGKTIGFGCRMCPPKFKADPDKYGPYYLRNEVINR